MIEDSVSSELAGCPFCGNEKPVLRTNTHAGMSWVACDNCGLEAPTETGVSAADAVSYWNRRSTIGGEPVAWDVADEGGVFMTTHRAHVAEEQRAKGYAVTPLFAHPAPSTGEADQYEPAAVRLLRGPLSKRATSAEFNEWQAREVIEYIDGLRALSTPRETMK